MAGNRAATAAQALSIVAPSGSSSLTSRVPASSRWIAKRRTRMRITTAATSRAPGRDEEAVASGQDGADEARVVEDGPTELAQRLGPVTRPRRPAARGA